MFQSIPVEVLWAIADACEGPENVASLAMTDRSLRFLLSDSVPEAVAGYVAVMSFSVQTIRLTLNARGPNSLLCGLRHQHTVTGNYALEPVLRSNSLEIFGLIDRYITRHHKSIENTRK